MKFLLQNFPVFALVAALLILATVPILAWTLGIPIGQLTRDPVQIAGISHYSGILSNFGILAWSGGVFIAGFTAAYLAQNARQADGAAFLRAICLVTLILCLDDFFVLHESLPVKEQITFLIYGLMVVAAFMFNWRAVRRSRYRFAIASACLFAVSLGIDAFQTPLQSSFGEIRILLEDGAKFIGAVIWLIFIWTTALDFIDDANKDLKS